MYRADFAHIFCVYHLQNSIYNIVGKIESVSRQTLDVSSVYGSHGYTHGRATTHTHTSTHAHTHTKYKTHTLTHVGEIKSKLLLTHISPQHNEGGKKERQPQEQFVTVPFF